MNAASAQDGDKARLRIIRPNLRETGSIGVGTWDAALKWWRVELEREKPPFRGQYEPGEVELLKEDSAHTASEKQP